MFEVTELKEKARSKNDCDRHHRYIKNGHRGQVVFEGRLLIQTSPVHKEWSYRAGGL